MTRPRLTLRDLAAYAILIAFHAFAIFIVVTIFFAALVFGTALASLVGWL